jgi:hypothetical protein
MSEQGFAIAIAIAFACFLLSQPNQQFVNCATFKIHSLCLCLCSLCCMLCPTSALRTTVLDY